MDKISVICSWRPSRDFPAYTVENLFKCVREAAGARDVQFYCLTTDPDLLPEPIIPIPAIQSEWINFWSKIEMFSLRKNMPEQLIYFDLDTIVNRIDGTPERFDGLWMIRDVGGNRRSNFASGVMAWNPSDKTESIYNDLVRWRKEKHFPSQRRRRRNRDGKGKNAFPNKGDQQFINMRREALGIDVLPLQKVWKITSFKKGIRKRGVDPEAQDIICFHGEPRPQHCPHPWVVDHFNRMDHIKI